MASGKREKEVHTGTGVIVGSLLRSVPLNQTILFQGLSRKNALGAKLLPSHRPGSCFQETGGRAAVRQEQHFLPVALRLDLHM